MIKAIFVEKYYTPFQHLLLVILFVKVGQFMGNGTLTLFQGIIILICFGFIIEYITNFIESKLKENEKKCSGM